MNIPPQALKEFIELYEKEYGITLVNDVAQEYATRIINFVRAVYGNKLPNEIELKQIVDMGEKRLNGTNGRS